MRKIHHVLVLCTMLLLSFNSLAFSKDLPSATDFFSLPDYTAINLSPSGKYMATLMPINNRLNIVVIETKNRKNISVLTGFKKYNVGSYFWASDDRIVFTVDQTDGQEALSLYSVTREKKPEITLNMLKT